MPQEHLFAQYIRALGKGKNGARPLTEQEAEDAMGMILRGEVEPEQLGAFMMLMRMKEETGAEVAGFVRAVRSNIGLPANLPAVDLDWSSYAGKRRHLPWFILSVLLLAQNGVRVLMHGTSGRSDGRLYTREILAHLGIAASESIDQAIAGLESNHFAYVDLQMLSPRLQLIMDMRALFGLRTPVHTVARMLNPFNAAHVMQGIFHPGYQTIHQQAALCLQVPHAAIIKGDGGEIERNPDAACQLYSVNNGVSEIEEWPAVFERRHVKPESLEPDDLLKLWRDEIDNEYAVGAVTGTLAIALRLLGRANSPAAAQQLADQMWSTRHRGAL